jgi:hypothetical protein
LEPRILYVLIMSIIILLYQIEKIFSYFKRFGYAHVCSPEEISLYKWNSARFEVPAVLLYDDEYKNVQSWGDEIRKFEKEGKIVELSKLLLGKMGNELPLSHEKAIADYLHELRKIVEEAICREYYILDFYKHVRIILTVSNFNIL